MTKPRTRIAPSPTGDPHVGTAYIALFNKVFAESRGGDFILRIEDTDRQRSTASSERAILESLGWLGLSWSEGPDIGGPFGPYRQSDRKALYQKYAQQLLDSGHAFRCFCTPKRLAELREQQRAAGEEIGYDGHCSHLTEAEIAAKLAAGEPYVVRMKVPENGVCVIKDELRGSIEIDWQQIDMQVLLKSDGFPTYHLASVVDDHLMQITHIIRGEEWISSTPKQIALYHYFGWQVPTYVHLPLLRNPDQSKLSKRKNPTSIRYYRDLGILPEALLNFLATMGWTQPGGAEIFSLEDMKAAFDLERVTLGGPIFDQDKLRWLNGKYLREQHSAEQLLRRLVEWKFNSAYVEQLMPLAQSRADTLADMAPLLGFFFAGNPPITAESFASDKLDADALKAVLQLIIWQLEQLRDWQKDAIFAVIKGVVEAKQLKFKDINSALFVAITGTTASVSVMDAMTILGTDMTRARLQNAILVLGGLGKKKLKALEKEQRELAISTTG